MTTQLMYHCYLLTPGPQEPVNFSKSFSSFGFDFHIGVLKSVMLLYPEKGSGINLTVENTGCDVLSRGQISFIMICLVRVLDFVSHWAPLVKHSV